MSEIRTKSELNRVNVNIAVTDDTYVERYLSAINGILNLSKRELEVLMEFVKLYDPAHKDVCHRDVRRKVQANLEFPSKAALNNYIKFLTTKGVLTSTDTGYKFHPLVEAVRAQPGSVTMTFQKPVGS